MTGEEENWTFLTDYPGSGGAIELYNCPDQETNDPESVRSWAIFKPGELKHTRPRGKDLIIFIPAPQSSLISCEYLCFMTELMLV